MILAALFGAAVGSFLNVCIDRLPAGRSLFRPASHCEACGHPLHPQDLVPVLSYLWLRGRCRYCRAPVPLRLPLVEAGTAGLFALLAHRFQGINLQFLVAAYYASLFLVIAIIDLDHGLILNKLVYPALALALPLSLIQQDNSPLSAIIGAGIGLALALVPLLFPGGMGWGDVKMSALMGLALGFPQTLVALGLAVSAGGAVAALLLVARIKGRREAIPFGPFLSLGAVAALLWGQRLLGWYLGLFS